MKAKILFILLIYSSIANGQKEQRVYKLPDNIQPSEYSQNSVLVKWKNEKKQKSSSRTTLNVPGVSIQSLKPLAPTTTAQATTSWRGPLKPSSRIDIRMYERILLQPGQNIEVTINKLYASGYFEIVEPEFVNKMSFNPNDPSTSQQYYLDLINAYEAWDVTQGSEEVVIAIIDSGGDLDHPDLAANIYNNPDEIAGNGLDDDTDGYIDNVNGWDFVGGDTLNIFNSSFSGDNDPNLKQVGDPGVLTHGVWVAGCASAATNNGVGIAGVGFKSKLLFTKHTADNQNPQSLSVFFGYDGILYAASTLAADNVSRKIINCSWGGSFRSQIAQDLITYVTFDLGCLVIGAAGNENSEAPHFPSGYDYVLSVAATNQNDVKASFSNTGYTVDISAPGVSILSTEYNDQYGSVQGTSFSCPIVAGAAALLWAHNSGLTALQVAEQLRASSDASIYSKNATSQKDKLGKGRLDIASALTYSGPSIRAANPRLLNEQGGSAEPGQTAFLSFDFTNYLSSSTGGLTVKIIPSSTNINFPTSQITLGIIGENESMTRNFQATIRQAAPENAIVNVTLQFTDGTYSDFQVVSFNVNPSFLNVEENKITTTLSSRGRIGFDDPDNQEDGNGFVFNDDPILYEMGIMMATSSSTLYNNVRGIGGAFDQDFSPIDRIRKKIPGDRSTSEVYGSFANNTQLSNASLQVFYRSLVRNDAPYDKFVILEYKIKNVSSQPINNLRFGIFSDWDISGNGAQDAAAWNAEENLGYVFPRLSEELPHAGIQVLNQSANYYAIDNSQDIAGNPFGLYDGYTDEEKFTSLSSERLQAGMTENDGNDVSHVVSAAPVSIASGEEVTIAFAIHAANNISELIQSAQHADTLYNLAFQLPQPVVSFNPVCYGEGAHLNASGSLELKWYNSFTGGEPIATGNSLSTEALFSDTTLYVANALDTYESIRTIVRIELKAKPAVSLSGSTVFCEGESVTLTASQASEYVWSNGETTQSIEVSTAGTFSVTVREPSLSCQSQSQEITTSLLTLPTASFIASSELIENDPITFTDESIDAVAWAWDFGDTKTSTLQNPTHTFTDPGLFEVTLTVANTSGCKDTYSQTFYIITGLEMFTSFPVTIYPNPSQNIVQVNATMNGTSAILEVMTTQGCILFSEALVTLDRALDHTISLANLSAGIYLLKVRDGDKVVIRKIVKN